MEFRTKYNHDQGGHDGKSFMVPNKKTGELEPEVTRTKQSHKDECDVNLILKSWRYGDGKPITHVNEQVPTFGDFSAVQDFATAKQRVAAAEAEFANLPSDLRREMDNDPAKLLEYIEEASNYQEAVELGLIDPEVDPPPPETVGETPTETPPPEGESQMST